MVVPHLLVCLVLQGADDLKALGDEGHGFIAICLTHQACSVAACGKLAIMTRGLSRDPFYRLHMRMDDLTQHCVLVRRRDGKGLASVVQGKRDSGYIYHDAVKTGPGNGSNFRGARLSLHMRAFPRRNEGGLHLRPTSSFAKHREPTAGPTAGQRLEGVVFSCISGFCVQVL